MYAEATLTVTTNKSESSRASIMQTTLVDTIGKSAKHGSSSAQVKKLNRAVAYHIAKDAVPPLRLISLVFSS